MTDELLARHRAVMPSWMSLLYEEPIEIVHAHDRRMTDSQGRTYLDFFAGVLTNSMGYDVAEIGDAVRKQLDTGILHTSTLYLIRSQVELAERIASLSGIPDAKVFFTNSGSEANDTALMLATQFRRSNQVLAMRNSYHGRSFGTVAITGNRGWSASALSPVKVSYVHGGYRYRSPFRDLSDADYIDACVADLVDVLDHATAGDVACLIAEPIQGVGGFSLAAGRAVRGDEGGAGRVRHAVHLRRGADRLGPHRRALLGHRRARRHAGHDDVRQGPGERPGGRRRGGPRRRDGLLSRRSRSRRSAATRSRWPAQRRCWTTSRTTTCRRTARPAAELLDGLRGPLRRRVVAEVRGKGLMIGDRAGQAGHDRRPNVGGGGADAGGDESRGLLVGKGGLHGNVLRLGPPMTLTEEEAQEGLDILVDSLAATHAALVLRPQSTSLTSGCGRLRSRSEYSSVRLSSVSGGMSCKGTTQVLRSPGEHDGLDRALLRAAGRIALAIGRGAGHRRRSCRPRPGTRPRSARPASARQLAERSVYRTTSAGSDALTRLVDS